MKEIQKIIEAYDKLKAEGKNGALATLVKVEGSSYRRAGARMLMSEDGHWTGAISGGCLEGDALRRSRRVMLEGKPEVVTYDTMNDESAQSLSVGLGCNGIVDVLLEPLDFSSPQNPIELLRHFITQQKPEVLATVFVSDHPSLAKAGERMMLQSNGHWHHTLQNEVLKKMIEEEIPKTLEQGKSATRIFSLPQGQVTVFMEVLHPALELWVYGAGYDAIPLVRMAAELGWRVIVTDDCAAKAIPSRYPDAHQVKLIMREGILDQINITPYTAAVVMSHSYKYDLAVLEKLISTSIPYIGLLGPKKRTLKMQEELVQKGISLDLDRIHSPVGLDLGAETPEEIALAILAEVQAHFRQKKGGFLKEKEGFIHEREPVSEPV